MVNGEKMDKNQTKELLNQRKYSKENGVEFKDPDLGKSFIENTKWAFQCIKQDKPMIVVLFVFSIVVFIIFRIIKLI
jgi:hypothetical protein